MVDLGGGGGGDFTFGMRGGELGLVATAEDESSLFRSERLVIEFSLQKGKTG